MVDTIKKKLRKGVCALALQSGSHSHYAHKILQFGLKPDSPIYLLSRIQSVFGWIQLDFVGVWTQLRGINEVSIKNSAA